MLFRSPGVPLQESALQGTGIVHQGAVDRLDEIAGSQPGAGGRAGRFEILEDRSPGSVLAPEKIRSPQAGAQRGGTSRPALLPRAAEGEEQAHERQASHGPVVIHPVSVLQARKAHDKVSSATP